MNDLASLDMPGPHRLTDLARRALRARSARLRLPDDPGEAEDASALLVELPCAPAQPPVGTLVVVDEAGRDWSAEDRDTAGDIAGALADLLLAERRLRVAGRPGRDDALRTPLQAIVGFAGLLQGETRPEVMGDHARAILSAVASLQAVMDGRADAPNGEAPAADHPAPEADEAGVPADGAHILLADDLDLNRKLISDMLSLEGHVVDSVADGAAAVKAARETSYDLILMDMIMPGMDGVAATRAIRALPAPACEVPIVALTAHSLPEQLDSCIQAGMDATLTKPMTMNALTDAVATWTRRRRNAA